MPAEDKVGLDPLLEGGKAQFLEASDFGLGERLGREIRERRPAPETECCSQGLCGGSGLTCGEKLSTLSEQALKTAEVDLLGLDREPVTMSTRLQAPVTERFAQLRDVDVDAVERARGRPALPERVDQAVCRDDFAAAQEKDREQRALLSRSDLEWRSACECLEGTEDAELERVFRSRQVPPLSSAHKRRASEIQGLLKRADRCSRSLRSSGRRNEQEE